MIIERTYGCRRSLTVIEAGCIVLLFASANLADEDLRLQHLAAAGVRTKPVVTYCTRQEPSHSHVIRRFRRTSQRRAGGWFAGGAATSPPG
jgi:hypothetical protein